MAQLKKVSLKNSISLQCMEINIPDGKNQHGRRIQNKIPAIFNRGVHTLIGYLSPWEMF